MLVAFLFGVVVGVAPFLLSRARRVPQNEAEVTVSTVLRQHFSGDAFHLIDNLTLPYGESTTQIDHVLISRHGIFVIETKGYKGWIFGNEKSSKWTQVLYRAKFRFGNPVRQNAGHVAALRELFTLDRCVFHSIIVFCGQAEFKTEMPANVIHYQSLANYIKRFSDDMLSYNQLVYAVGRIETKRLDRSREVDERHRHDVAERLARLTNRGKR